MEFRWVPWRVLCVSKVILFQGGVGRSLIEKGLNSAVNVSNENIFFPLGNARAKKFEGAESGKTETGDVRDILGSPLLGGETCTPDLWRGSSMKGEGRDSVLPFLDRLCNALLNLLGGRPFAKARRKWKDTKVPLDADHRD
eukprot:gene16524-11819_t